MNIDIQLSTEENRFIIHNLYPLYLHDLSEIWGNKPNRFGVYEEGDTKTLSEQNEIFHIWWQKPSVLFPFLIRVDQMPAGFAFVATPPYVPSEAQYYLNEFFVLRPYRGTGAAEEAAKQVFERFKGCWELQTGAMPHNGRAQSFWRRTLTAYTNGAYTEGDGAYPDGEKRVFRFSNNTR